MTDIGVTQNIIITSPANNSRLCPGKNVTITCITRGSLIIIWSSREYTGHQLELASFNTVGYRINSTENSNTFANLTRKATEGGMQVLESQLHIIVSDVASTSSVTCINQASGNSSTINFQIIGKSAYYKYNQFIYIMLLLTCMLIT